jgi:uncharacterized repeat protein (TIGR03803 family)
MQIGNRLRNVTSRKIRTAILLPLGCAAGFLPIHSRAQAIEQQLHHFGMYGDGVGPHAGLVQGIDGALYGTTQYGGLNNYNGTLFTLRTNGAGYAVRHNFSGTGGNDGSYPFGGALVQGTDGALYGTTIAGGSDYNGAVFKLSTNGGGDTLLYSFTDTGGDGAVPNAGLVQGTDGALYGTTTSGGTNDYGTVFTLGTNGLGYKALYSFTGSAGGANPNGGLVQGADGALYGTTFQGGTNGVGTVFTLGTNGAGYAVLHVFTNTPGDGASPLASLTQGSDGALYGTTSGGGASGNGTVFRIGTNGSNYRVLYSFTGAGGDGANPDAGIIQANNGALYGTTENGGTNGQGTVFKLGTNGAGMPSYTVSPVPTGTGQIRKAVWFRVATARSTAQRTLTAAPFSALSHGQWPRAS